MFIIIQSIMNVSIHVVVHETPSLFVVVLVGLAFDVDLAGTGVVVGTVLVVLAFGVVHLHLLDDHFLPLPPAQFLICVVWDLVFDSKLQTQQKILDQQEGHIHLHDLLFVCLCFGLEFAFSRNDFREKHIAIQQDGNVANLVEDFQLTVDIGHVGA